MDFVPCARCRRHVAALEDACPFCGTSRTPIRRALVVKPGRLSRAAVFAGLAACYTSGPPPAPPRSPPPDGSGATTENQRWVRGSALQGKLTNVRTGAPLVGVIVEVWTSGNEATTATTNANGEYVIEGLEPRDYTVSFSGPDGIRYAASKIVEVRGSKTAFDLAFDPVAVPVAKPYGAPPARRRVV
jgi:hypothetical protein